MKPNKDKAYLLHIIESCDLVAQHARLLPDPNLQWFEHPTVRDATLRTLQTMTESCQRLSSGAKSRSAEIPWEKITAFRNVLVHEYLGNIDYALVTDVLVSELPRLKEAVSRIYGKLYA